MGSAVRRLWRRLWSYLNQPIMKKNVVITMPDNLSEAEELILLAKRLRQKLLSGSGNALDLKRIGPQQFEAQELETTITIKRVPTEKPVVLAKCNCCGADYDPSMAKPLWVNYGGKQRKVDYCSEECREVTLSICGPGRAAINRKDLKNVFATMW